MHKRYIFGEKELLLNLFSSYKHFGYRDLDEKNSIVELNLNETELLKLSSNKKIKIFEHAEAIEFLNNYYEKKEKQKDK